MQGDFIAIIVEYGPFNGTGTKNGETTADTFENCRSGRWSEGKEVFFIITDATACSGINTDGLLT